MSSLDLINRPWQGGELEGPTLVPEGLDSLYRLERRDPGKTGRRNPPGEPERREELLWNVPRCRAEITSLRATGALPHRCYQTNKPLASARCRKLSPDRFAGCDPNKAGLQPAASWDPSGKHQGCHWFAWALWPTGCALYQTSDLFIYFLIYFILYYFFWSSCWAFLMLWLQIFCSCFCGSAQRFGISSWGCITHKMWLLLAEFWDDQSSLTSGVVQPFCLTSVL